MIEEWPDEGADLPWPTIERPVKYIINVKHGPPELVMKAALMRTAVVWNKEESAGGTNTFTRYEWDYGGR